MQFLGSSYKFFLWEIVFVISLLAELNNRQNNLTCLVRRRACLNVRKSPSAAVNRPLSMWTDDLGWLGGSGLPTLCGKPKKNLYKTKQKPFKWDINISTYDFLKMNPQKFLLSAECASMSEKGVLPCLTSHTQSMPSCPPVATMCCWFGCLSTQCRGTLLPDLKRKHHIQITYNHPHTKCTQEREGKGKNKCLGMWLVWTEEILQWENLGWWVALLSEIPQLELADRVHRQNLCCPQVSHSMNRAAVRIFWQWLNGPIKDKNKC